MEEDFSPVGLKKYLGNHPIEAWVSFRPCSLRAPHGRRLLAHEPR